MLDEISQAVLEREEVVKYLRGDYGERGEQARERIYAYLEELRTTQRYPIYRALQHPLYPILRKIERTPENLHHVLNATRDPPHRLRVEPQEPHRLSRSSRSSSTTTASARRSSPPASTCSAVRSVCCTGTSRARFRSGGTPRIPAYLITLKAYVAEMLKKHDLFFYPEGGRSYSGELKPAKTGLDSRGA